MRGTGIMGRKLVIATVTMAMLGLALASSVARARPGDLDPKFGHRGRAFMGFPHDEKPQHFAVAEWGDGIVAASDNTVVKLSPNGSLDRSFGGGRVDVPPVLGTRFRVADVGVDSLDRVVVIGTSYPVPPAPLKLADLNGPNPSWATVHRFRPDGSPDESFGDGGRVLTDLGIPPPEVPPTSLPGEWERSDLGPWDNPSSVVGARHLSIDGRDRLVLTGEDVIGVTFVPDIKGSDLHAETAYGSYVARLTEDGSADHAFAGDGVLRVWNDRRASGQTFEPSVTPDSIVGLGRSGTYLLARLTQHGEPDLGFGAGGYLRVRQFVLPIDLKMDPFGRILLLGYPIADLRPPGAPGKSMMIIRLLPSGKPDPSFGEHGRRVLKLGWRTTVRSIATDGRGRILLAGVLFSRHRHRGLARATQLLLIRLQRSGRADPRFGRRGLVVEPLRRRSQSGVLGVSSLPGGRILVAAITSSLERGSHKALGLARFQG